MQSPFVHIAIVDKIKSNKKWVNKMPKTYSIRKTFANSFLSDIPRKSDDNF